jgi:hypothetical protein
MIGNGRLAGKVVGVVALSALAACRGAYDASGAPWSQAVGGDEMRSIGLALDNAGFEEGTSGHTPPHWQEACKPHPACTRTSEGCFAGSGCGLLDSGSFNATCTQYVSAGVVKIGWLTGISLQAKATTDKKNVTEQVRLRVGNAADNCGAGICYQKVFDTTTSYDLISLSSSDLADQKRKCGGTSDFRRLTVESFAGDHQIDDVRVSFEPE